MTEGTSAALRNPLRAARRLGLHVRLALVATLVLIAGLVAIGWVLERSFNAAVRAGAQEHLRTVVFGLLGAAEERDGVLVFRELGEPRLGRADSGLLAFVDDSGGEVHWRSPSLILSGRRMAEQRPLERRPRPGEYRFDDVRLSGEPRYVFAYTVVWESLAAQMTFWVLAEQSPYRLQVAAFRRSAAMGLGALGIVFVGIQLAALLWGLRPVRAMAERVRGVEAGARSDIGADYPVELAGLASNLNHFIANEKASRDRHRRAMEDLAHSLKTPLTVVRNAAGGEPLLREQLDRMESAVARQLSRAAAARGAGPTDRVAVMPVAARIVRALRQAHDEKRVIVELLPSEESDLALRVDERDLMEMLGNLIENGFKYTRRRLRVSACVAPASEHLRIEVEDDGPGVPSVLRQAILQRGVRGETTSDSPVAGHGVGLAVAAELAAVYEGSLQIGESAAFGGASFALELPRAK